MRARKLLCIPRFGGVRQQDKKAHPKDKAELYAKPLVGAGGCLVTILLGSPSKLYIRAAESYAAVG